MDYRAAALSLAADGYTSVPLGLDAAGKPKRPLPLAWQQTTVAVVDSLPWGAAVGLGVVLGSASGNLAVIDLDDSELGRAAWAVLVRGHVWTRMVETVSGNAHVYVRELNPSPSTRGKYSFRGREVGVELKAIGTQVAAPPTPGYTVLLDYPPVEVPSIGAAWASLAAKLGILATAATRASAGYPHPWQAEVELGERNKAMYIEAHRLREAGMQLDEALALLQLRFESSYEEGGVHWQEMEATIRSAYRKGLPTQEALVSWIP